jgi:hypothetical protein
VLGGKAFSDKDFVGRILVANAEGVKLAQRCA